MAQEIRIEISDEAYEQLRQSAEQQHLDAATYAGKILNEDLTRERFLGAAQRYIDEFGPAFAERFGAGSGVQRDAA
ncbi:hypothetical protein [Streptomyces flavofungini]|uniref:hypothetical protein n=1 Tax=Streptomyces flavofungini TaxID=68200 RepID=UPI0025B018CE|nr:hypothetical protein [Streptomyces flavofungini]WJV51771.1 hypothetical protein QUY26_39785 [Streptomyces flavofungini]